MIKKILLIFLFLSIHSTAFGVKFRTNYFFSPQTGTTLWDGNLGFLWTHDAQVTFVDDPSLSSPNHISPKINNNDNNTKNTFNLSDIGLDINLTVHESVDIILNGAFLGLRWQFLNNKSSSNNWIAGIQLARRTDTTTDKPCTPESACSNKESNNSKQGGLSLGYKYNKFLLYTSYIYESHEVTSNVENQTGVFGPFLDKGTHNITSIGFHSVENSFLYAIEFSGTEMSWSNTIKSYQSNFGVKFGFHW